MGTPSITTNSSTDLNLGNVPQEIEDPAVYEALLNVHSAIESLLTLVDDADTGLFTALNAYVSARTNVLTVTADYSITSTNGTVIVDSSLNAVTATLPTAVGISGTRFVIKHTSVGAANFVDVATALVETIDGDTNDFDLSPDETLVVQSDGSNWHIV